MKNLILAFIILFTVSFSAEAQKPYSDEYLKKASADELDMYYNKAVKHQKAGRVMNIAGTSVLGVSGLGIAAFGSSMGMAAILFVFPVAAGIITLAVGIPMNLTAKNRIERINAIRSKALKNVAIELVPLPQYSYVSRSYEPGLTLRIRF